MPQYRPPQQVHFSPVTNYYQGKAIRTQQKANEQAIEFNELKMNVMKDELENAPSERARAKELSLLKIDNIVSQIDERLANGERDKLKYSDEIMKPLFQAYSDEPKEAKALEVFNTGLPEAISRLPQDEQDRFLEAAGPDRKFSHEEIMTAGLARRVFEEKEKETKGKSDYTLGDTRYSGSTNKPIATNPKDGGTDSPFAKPSIKDFTQESIAKYSETRNPADLVPREDEAKLSDRDKKLRDVKALGSSDAEAIDLVDKYISVTSSTDSGGNVTVTNTRTGKAHKLSARKARAAGLLIPAKGEDIVESSGYVGPRWSQPIALISPSPNIQEILITEAQRSMQEIDKGLVAGGLISAQDVMSAAGAQNIMQRGINNAGQLGSLNTLPRFFAEETDARLKVLNFNQAVRSAVVISSKGAMWEQQKVEEMLPNPDSLLENPVGAGVAYTRTMHWLMNQREAEVALLEGRTPSQIPRVPLGVKDDPIIITSEDEADGLPAGTWVMMNGRLGEI